MKHRRQSRSIRRNTALPTTIEALESRRLMTFSGQIHYGDFNDTSHIVTNGIGRPLNLGTPNAYMTVGNYNEAASAWFDTKVPFDNFTTHFTIRVEPVSYGWKGDGFTFTLQNGTSSAIGLAGSNLGYSGGSMPTQSVAIAFNTFNNTVGGATYGIHSDPTAYPVTPVDMSPLDLGSIYNQASYNPFDVTMSYDGTNLTTSLVSQFNNNLTFTNTQAVNLRQILGGSTAYVGFTAATGASRESMALENWDYTGAVIPPSIANSATATAVTIGRDSTLGVSGADPAGETDLDYTWSVLRAPAGAKPVSFSANGTNGAKNASATFSKDGAYRLRVTATNSDGLIVRSNVTVSVGQVATSIRMNPHAKQYRFGQTQQYGAVVFDQFNHRMRTQPSMTFDVDGVGSIDSAGWFSAEDTKGHAEITASAADLLAVVGATVTK